MQRMMTLSDFDRGLKALETGFDILGPVRQAGTGRFSDTDVIGYGKISRISDLVLDEKSFFSPKEAVFPVRETLFRFSGSSVEETKGPERPVLLILRPCDINGIGRLDTIYLKNGPIEDPYYKRRRDNVKFLMLECTEGFDSCFCVSMGSNRSDLWDGAVRIDGTQVKINIKDAALKAGFDGCGVDEPFEPSFIEENKIQVLVPEPGTVTKAHFDHPLWQEYTQRCIHCGRCNTSCVTCSCFTMQDILYDENGQLGERRRRWAGCHVDGFSDMAGGHSFRKKDGERMRFKTMHKINDFHRRFGTHMCVGCGRCDDVCPEYISFSKCINKLNQIIEEESHDK